MEIRAAEITDILKKQIAEVNLDAKMEEVGQVVKVGDGIATVYGLENVQAGELVEFANGTTGMTLNL